MSEEEKKAIEYFEEKIKNKLPLYTETYVDGKLYRMNILQLETKFTEEQANKTRILLNLIDKQQKEIENIEEYVNSPEFLDWHLGFTLLDELEYRKNNINELLEE